MSRKSDELARETADADASSKPASVQLGRQTALLEQPGIREADDP
jgi:hypothetical protein